MRASAVVHDEPRGRLLVRLDDRELQRREVGLRDSRVAVTDEPPEPPGVTVQQRLEQRLSTDERHRTVADGAAVEPPEVGRPGERRGGDSYVSRPFQAGGQSRQQLVDGLADPDGRLAEEVDRHRGLLPQRPQRRTSPSQRLGVPVELASPFQRDHADERRLVPLCRPLDEPVLVERRQRPVDRRPRGVDPFRDRPPRLRAVAEVVHDRVSVPGQLDDVRIQTLSPSVATRRSHPPPRRSPVPVDHAPRREFSTPVY